MMPIVPRLSRSLASGIEWCSRRKYTVLGIETSCDDTAVAIVNDDRVVLSSRRYTDRNAQKVFGGICPGTVAQQHKYELPRLVDECIQEAGCSMDNVDAIAVTTKPGLVIALKEGIHTALRLSRAHRKPLIPVHHMKAHALSASLVSPELTFPFASLLISGGHSLIVLAHSVDKFIILGKSVSGSAGECLDKVARELRISDLPEFQTVHAGAAMETLAARANADGHLRYSAPGPTVEGADMNFSQLKSSFLQRARTAMMQPDFALEDFCASTQFHVTRHLMCRLNAAFDHLKSSSEKMVEHLVISGGVAANEYICTRVGKLCAHYGVTLIRVPPRLCTDNAEMIAWTGILMAKENSPDIHWWPDIPESIYAHARYDIGEDLRSSLPRRAVNKLSGSSVHGDAPIKLINKQSFKQNTPEI